MASDPDFVDYVREQIGLGDRLTRRRMFGEYALYVDGKVVAFVCDNSLFVKPSPAVAELARTCRGGRRTRARRITRLPTNCSTMPMPCRRWSCAPPA
jgi:TfoX/Sxy family transcriptional regulator of competence genes